MVKGAARRNIEANFHESSPEVQSNRWFFFKRTEVVWKKTCLGPIKSGEAGKNWCQAANLVSGKPCWSSIHRCQVKSKVNVGPPLRSEVQCKEDENDQVISSYRRRYIINIMTSNLWLSRFMIHYRYYYIVYIVFPLRCQYCTAQSWILNQIWLCSAQISGPRSLWSSHARVGHCVQNSISSTIST